MTAPTYIPAIETEYAGCRFRSRLEARWAVFFDHLGIQWEHEPQGFNVSWRLSNWFREEDSFRYLPDFYLPQLGLWCEVKGSLTQDQAHRLLNAIASISDRSGGGCSGPENDVLLLGPIPRPDATPTLSPWRLHMHKGDLRASAWAPGYHDECSGYTIAYDAGANWDQITDISEWPRDRIIDQLLAGGPAPALRHGLKSAYKAARSARFEHGENG